MFNVYARSSKKIYHFVIFSLFQLAFIKGETKLPQKYAKTLEFLHYGTSN